MFQFSVFAAAAGTRVLPLSDVFGFRLMMHVGLLRGVKAPRYSGLFVGL